MTKITHLITGKSLRRIGTTVAAIALMVGTGQAQQLVEPQETGIPAHQAAAAFVPSDEALRGEAALLPEPALDTVVPAAAEEIAAEPEAEVIGQGIASYYGSKFHGRRTASGQAFDMHAMTAAHRTLPFGSQVRVTNKANGKSVIVTVNDRGPFVRGREIDVSRAAAEQLGIVGPGHGKVEIALLNG